MGSLSQFICKFLVVSAYVFENVASTFTNYRANERHDGYLSFDKDVTLPLSLKWNNTNNACSFSLTSDFVSIAISNDIMYCINNNMGTDDNDHMRNANSSISAYNISDNKLLWTNYIYKQSDNILTTFNGIALLPNFDNKGVDYISIADGNIGNIYILNAVNGNLLYNKSIPNKPSKTCSYNTTDNDGVSCMVVGIVAVTQYESIIGYYTLFYNESISTIFEYDIKNDVIKTINTSFNSIAILNLPTICNDTIITWNLFEGIHAFSLTGTDEIHTLWNFKFTNQRSGHLEPAVCIPRINGGYNTLVMSNDNSWQLFDARTGKSIAQFEWYGSSAGSAVVNYNEMILIRADERMNLIAYNISDYDNNGNWIQLWSNSSFYSDLMIVNHNVYCVNTQILDVYSIKDGEFQFSWPIPRNEYGFFDAVTLSATIDQNKNPIILILAENQNQYRNQPIIFALQ